MGGDRGSHKLIDDVTSTAVLLSNSPVLVLWLESRSRECDLAKAVLVLRAKLVLDFLIRHLKPYTKIST